MRSIIRLFGAFGTLADCILALASVINVATDKLRLQLASESEKPALPHGEVIDATAGNGATSTKRRKVS
jgi:hypothetical protein